MVLRVLKLKQGHPWNDERFFFLPSQVVKIVFQKENLSSFPTGTTEKSLKLRPFLTCTACPLPMFCGNTKLQNSQKIFWLKVCHNDMVHVWFTHAHSYDLRYTTRSSVAHIVQLTPGWAWTSNLSVDRSTVAKDTALAALGLHGHSQAAKDRIQAAVASQI